MKSIVFMLLLSLGLYATTTLTGKIQETLSSGGYTYMKVLESGNEYWIAMTQRDVKVGESISYDEQGWMKNFKSKTLNRTFDNILFAGDPTAKTSQTAKLANIKPNVMTSQYKKDGTITIAELFENRDKYVGQSVTVRGKVSKVSTGIMKLNWIHIVDDSRFKNMDDLVFTTANDLAKEGDVVYATGVLAKDKDFGYGYFYPVIVESSSFKK